MVIASSISFEKNRERYKTIWKDDRSIRHDESKDVGPGIHMGLFNKRRGDNPKAVNVQSILDTSFNIMQREMARKYEEIANIVINSEVGDFGYFDLTKGSCLLGIFSSIPEKLCCSCQIESFSYALWLNCR